MMRRVEIWTRAVQAYQQGRVYRFSKEELKIVNAPDGTAVDFEESAHAIKLVERCKKLMAFLRERGEASRTVIFFQCFEHSLNSIELAAVINRLLAEKQVTETVVARAGGWGGGKQVRIYRPTPNALGIYLAPRLMPYEYKQAA